jgi:hypothetical protein
VVLAVLADLVVLAAATAEGLVDLGVPAATAEGPVVRPRLQVPIEAVQATSPRVSAAPVLGMTRLSP